MYIPTLFDFVEPEAKMIEASYIRFFTIVVIKFECKVSQMKKGIHPEYGDAVISCACGKDWKTKSTVKEMKVGICANCHPFFTGKQKLVDTAGRIERFRKRYGMKSEE